MSRKQSILIIAICIIGISSCSTLFKTREDNIVPDQLLIPPYVEELVIGRRIYDISSRIRVDADSLNTIIEDNSEVYIYVPFKSPPVKVYFPKLDSLCKYTRVPASLKAFLTSSNDERFVRIKYVDTMKRTICNGTHYLVTPDCQMLVLLVDSIGRRQTVFLESKEFQCPKETIIDGGIEGPSRLRIEMDYLRENDDFWEWKQ